MCFVADAHAYIDPNTGSVFLQILIAGTAGVLVVWRIFKNKIKEFLNKLWK